MTTPKAVFRFPFDVLLHLPRYAYSRTVAFVSNQGRYRALLRRHVAELFVFMRAWWADPRNIGAIVPSGPALSAAMTGQIDAARAPVIELGCGTGAFTRRLIARGVLPQDLALVELNAQFAQRLQTDFPDATVLCMDAGRLQTRELFGGRQAGAVVCGLPLLNMPVRTQIRILRSSFFHMRADGAFLLFTYGPGCPIARRLLDRLGLRARRLDTVLWNVPPAHVWKLSRRPDPAGARADGSGSVAGHVARVGSAHKA